MSRFVKVVLIGITIILGGLLERLLQSTGLAVTLLDIILLPLSLLLIYIVACAVIVDLNNGPCQNRMRHSSILMKTSYFLVFILLFVLGLWSAWQGIKDPLAYFNGVKGALHGYTMIPLGGGIVLLAVFGLSATLKTVIAKNSNIGS